MDLLVIALLCVVLVLLLLWAGAAAQAHGYRSEAEFWRGCAFEHYRGKKEALCRLRTLETVLWCVRNVRSLN